MEYKGYKSQALDFTVYQDGEKGDTGTSVVSIKTTYVLQANTVNLTTWNQAELDKLDWTDTPPSLQLDHTIWKRETTTFSNGEIETAPPIKDEALNSTYKLAQGKTTNYYGPNDPTAPEGGSHPPKIGDCWFDTSYQPVPSELKTKGDYLGKYIDSGTTKTKVTPENINKLTIEPGTTTAYTSGELKQCSRLDERGKPIWENIGGELVTNKLTAKYINALDITAKKVTIFDDNNEILFEANGIDAKDNGGNLIKGNVKIGSFDINRQALTGGDASSKNYIKFRAATPFVQNPSECKGYTGEGYTSEDSTVLNIKNWCNVTDWDNITTSDISEGSALKECIWNENDYTTYKTTINTRNDPDLIKQVTKAEIKLENTVIKKAYLTASGKTDITDITDEELKSINLNIDFKVFLGINSPSKPATIYSTEVYDCVIATTALSNDITTESSFKTALNDPIAWKNGRYELSDALKDYLQEFGRVEGPKRVGNSENLEELFYRNTPVDSIIYVFKVSVQQNVFSSDQTITYTDSAGNTRTEKENSSTTIPSSGYIVLPNTLQITPDVLEVGTKLKVKPDGTVYAQTINVDDNISAKYGQIGGFNFENNILKSKALTVTNSSVSMPLFKPLVIGKDDQPLRGLTLVSNSCYSKNDKNEDIRLSNLNQIKTSDKIEISAGEAADADNKASIVLESPLATTSGFITTKFEITVFGSVPTFSTSAVSDSGGIMPLVDNIGNLHPSWINEHYVLEGGGGTSTKYTTTVNLTAKATIKSVIKTTVNDDGPSSNSQTNEDGTPVVTPKEYTISIPIAVKIGSSWTTKTFTFTFEIKSEAGEGTTKQKTATVSDYSYSSYPTYYGIAASSLGNPIETYTTSETRVYSTDSTINYTPKITMHGLVSTDTIYATTVSATTVSATTVSTDTIDATTVSTDTISATTVSATTVSTDTIYVDDTLQHASDRRLKTNIAKIDLTDNLNDFYKQIEPVSFNYKSNTEKSHFGFIAQDLQTSFENTLQTTDTKTALVTLNPTTKHYMLDYTSMIALNTAQIKNLLIRIEELEKQVSRYQMESESSIDENK